MDAATEARLSAGVAVRREARLRASPSGEGLAARREARGWRRAVVRSRAQAGLAALREVAHKRGWRRAEKLRVCAWGEAVRREIRDIRYPTGVQEVS